MTNYEGMLSFEPFYLNIIISGVIIIFRFLSKNYQQNELFLYNYNYYLINLWKISYVIVKSDF
jgi:hypothetical protein